jgi:hypothetical protein
LFEVKKSDESVQTFNINPTSEPTGLQTIPNFGYVILDWEGIPDALQ